MRITYKQTALLDIQEKRDYIANVLHSRQAAQRLAARVLRAVSRLADAPAMDTPLQSRYEVDTDIRFLVVAKQLVFYRITGEEVIVLRVLDGRQDYMALLFPEE